MSKGPQTSNFTAKRIKHLKKPKFGLRVGNIENDKDKMFGYWLGEDMQDLLINKDKSIQIIPRKDFIIMTRTLTNNKGPGIDTEGSGQMLHLSLSTSYTISSKP